MKKFFVLAIAVLAIVTMGFTSCSKKTGKYDYSKILNGDLSQFAGTWVNGNGQTVTLRASGTFTFAEDQIAEDFSFNQETGSYNWIVGAEYDERWEGVWVEIIPVGVNARGYNWSTSSWEVAQTDTSKVRLFFPGIHEAHDVNSVPNMVYYFSGSGGASGAAVTPNIYGVWRDVGGRDINTDETWEGTGRLISIYCVDDNTTILATPTIISRGRLEYRGDNIFNFHYTEGPPAVYVYDPATKRLAEHDHTIVIYFEWVQDAVADLAELSSAAGQTAQSAPEEEFKLYVNYIQKIDRSLIAGREKIEFGEGGEKIAIFGSSELHELKIFNVGADFLNGDVNFTRDVLLKTQYLEYSTHIPEGMPAEGIYFKTYNQTEHYYWLGYDGVNGSVIAIPQER